jgi:hypothetical protein
MSESLFPQSEGYVRAINESDAAAFCALFDRDAVVDDAGREFRGIDAIKEWSDREIFAARVTLDVLGKSVRDGVDVITTKVDGDFDRTGLPDPLVMDHCIAVDGGKIVRLTCRLAG